MADGLLQRAGELIGAIMAAIAPTPGVRGGSKIVRQPAVESSSAWSIDSVRAALDLHERGDFSRSAQLVEAMGRDDRISSCLNTRLFALASSNGPEFSIQPPEGAGETGDALAKDVSAWWFGALPDATLRQLLSDAVMIGVAFARVEWVMSGKRWTIANVERWRPANIRWDADGRRFMARTDAEEVAIDPSDPAWLVIAPGGAEPWMCGAVRALGFAFVARQWNWRDWARFNERHGLPLLVIKEPPVTDIAQRDAFFLSLKRMGSQGILRLPQSADGVSGYDASMLEAKDAAHATFEAFRMALDVSIAVLLLGQNLTTEVQGGSLAAATAHNRVRGDYLAADAESMSSPLRDGLVIPWCVYNLPGFDPAQAPWPTWETSAPEDLGTESTTLKTFGEAVTSIRNAGVPLDVLELAQRFRVPLLEGADVADVVQPAAQAAPGQPTTPKDAGGKKTAKALATASGIPLMESSGFVEGQTFVDDVVDNYRADAGRAVRSMLLTELLAAIDGATTYEGVRAAVLKAYAGAASPEQTRDLVQKALVLCDLAGAASARQDA